MRANRQVAYLARLDWWHGLGIDLAGVRARRGPTHGRDGEGSEHVHERGPLSESVFRGLHSLLTVIGELIDRPHRSAPVPGVVDGDRPLPLLCLVRGSARHDVLAVLARRLDESPVSKVPFAAVDADLVAEQVEERWRDTEREAPLLPLLDELRHLLIADRFGHRRLTRFRHYRLADWLTGRRLTPGETRNERADVTDMLRLWHARGERPTAADEAAIADTAATQSTWLKIALVVFASWHRPLRFWLWSRGASLFGREPRWLMRQPFMVPGHSTSFTGFAERLTAGRRTEESLDQIKKLLVHAFLQDLRLAYGSGTHGLRRRRRTAYAVVLLEGITEDNGGWELLRLVNDVRNESTEHDPVLFVATAAALPAWLAARQPLPPTSRVQTELDCWYRGLPARRQSLRGDARFIAVDLPGATEDPPPTDADESAWHTKGDIRPRPVPVFARPSVIASALVVALVAAGLVGGSWLWPRFRGECLPSVRPGVATKWTPVSGSKSELECVGYSDSAAQVFGTDKTLRKAQLAVFESNADAEALHEGNPDRPLVTVVYFSEFTTPESRTGSADAVTEELTGILARQRDVNVGSEQVEPLLRVVVANGGHEMGHARTVVDELLAPLFANDLTVMGVLGMGRTVEPTESAIAALGDLGVPVVATSLTGKGLTTRSPMYFQLVAGNQAQADLVKVFAAGRKIKLYQPVAAKDGYLSSLREAMDVDPHPITWENGHVAGMRPDCDPNGIAYFAGRESDFEGFLDRVTDGCAVGSRPVVVGGDAVSRFVAQKSVRDQPNYEQQSMAYVSLGGLVVTRNASCFVKDAKGWRDARVPDLCSVLRSLRDRKGGPADVAWREFGAVMAEDAALWIGERVGIAFDGAGLFVRAVKANLNERKRVDATRSAPNRAAIAQELRELPCPEGGEHTGATCYEGVSGRIDFSGSRDGRGRPVAILAIRDIRNTADGPTCVLMVPASAECAGTP
jgi:hypothetical protein